MLAVTPPEAASDGQIVSFTYDNIGRLWTKDLPARSLDVAYATTISVIHGSDTIRTQCVVRLRRIGPTATRQVPKAP